jgi:hypothetical protein
MSPLGRPRNRWEDDIKMSPNETGFEAGAGLMWLRIEKNGRLL